MPKYIYGHIFYPTIYAQKTNSVIDDIKKESGLSMNTQTEPIAIDDTTAPNGFLSASTSINPYQTYYYASSSFTKTAFKDVQNSELNYNYYELLMSKDTDTYYWVASRYIQHHTSSCEFGINYIDESRINMIDLSYSDQETQYYSCKFVNV